MDFLPYRTHNCMTRGAFLEVAVGREDWVRNAGDSATVQLPSVVSASEHQITILLQVTRAGPVKIYFVAGMLSSKTSGCVPNCGSSTP
jgi:hypothetical protein